MYVQCYNCKGWLRLDKPHYTAVIDGVLVYLHHDACHWLVKYKAAVTHLKRHQGEHHDNENHRAP